MLLNAAILAAILLAWSPALAVPTEYAEQRQDLIIQEQNMQIGSNGSGLTPMEQVISYVLLQEKQKLIEAAQFSGETFTTSLAFLKESTRVAIEDTTAFKIIKKMPKGGILHMHDLSMVSTDWMVQNVTYRPDLYMCFRADKNNDIDFIFSPAAPTDTDNCAWGLVATLRADAKDIADFDSSLRSKLTLVTADPATAYPSKDAVWTKLRSYISKIESLISYTPVLRDYIWEGLKQMRDDKVQYCEIRAILPQVLEFDGTVHDAAWVLELYQVTISKFNHDFPDFAGCNIIKSTSRLQPVTDMLTEVQLAIQLFQDNPDFVLGFDIVGQEDKGSPLLDYIDQLLFPSQCSPPVQLPYFFHAGETDWEQTETDYNLLDAVLLNTTRIGHGYALTKHPLLKQIVKERQITVEVNPISNQVLKLVADPRDHPAASLIAENFPLVISSDDYAAWDALPLSHDFYFAFMALTGEDAGLATLKQLAINSIRFSALSDQKKEETLAIWEEQYAIFLQSVVDLVLVEQPLVEAVPIPTPN